ncbi:hypothetical protein DMUE_4197 [Dictyocoela muelleri]|nr:hypothetical protein DMUE_4197 [Dictyocoela muelleri]
MINFSKNIIKSKKNKERIAYEGYFYNFKDVNSGKITWRCNKSGCPVLFRTNMSYDLCGEMPMHPHVIDEKKYNCVLLSARIKERALLTPKSRAGILLFQNVQVKLQLWSTPGIMWIWLEVYVIAVILPNFLKVISILNFIRRLKKNNSFILTPG